MAWNGLDICISKDFGLNWRVTEIWSQIGFQGSVQCQMINNNINNLLNNQPQKELFSPPRVEAVPEWRRGWRSEIRDVSSSSKSWSRWHLLLTDLAGDPLSGGSFKIFRLVTFFHFSVFGSNINTSWHGHNKKSHPSNHWQHVQHTHIWQSHHQMSPTLASLVYPHLHHLVPTHTFIISSLLIQPSRLTS